MNQLVKSITQVKAQTKMSFVFISNTIKYQGMFEDFGSSLVFGGSQAIQTQENKPQLNDKS